MSEEMRLPVIRWHEGLTVPKPEGHVPSFIEVGEAGNPERPPRVIDEELAAWICDALLAEHPESERLREIWTKRPGLNFELREDMILVKLAATGEPVGLFDRRLLNA
jgi:hypothetical protein